MDQGVDYGNVSRINAIGGGVITAIQTGLSGWGTRIIERLNNPIFGPQGEPESEIYYAEETGGGTPSVRAGQLVKQGQEIAPGIPSGSIEVGILNPQTGEALGAPGYYEGKVTDAGRAFQRDITGKAPIVRPDGSGGAGSGGGDTGGSVDQIFAAYQAEINMDRTAPSDGSAGFVSLNKAGWKTPFQWWMQSFLGKWEAEGSSGKSASPLSPSGSPPPATKGAYNKAQLEQLWTSQGGNPAAAGIAAAIALAESGGNPDDNYAPGPQEDSRGLWQINVAPTANPQYGKLNLYDPTQNVKIAIAMSQNGRNWRPWTTFTSGDYRKFL